MRRRRLRLRSRLAERHRWLHLRREGAAERHHRFLIVLLRLEVEFFGFKLRLTALRRNPFLVRGASEGGEAGQIHQNALDPVPKLAILPGSKGAL